MDGSKFIIEQPEAMIDSIILGIEIMSPRRQHGEVIMAKRSQLLLMIIFVLLLPGLRPGLLAQSETSHSLNGTWSLDASRSDDIRDAINRAVEDRASDSDRLRTRLQNRLQPPERLAIEHTGPRITMSSSSAPPVTFEADGRTRTEARANGRSVRTTASLNSSRLTVRTQGDRANDFQVTFEPIENGRTLRVTRRMSNDRLTQPIETRSFYTHTSDVARMESSTNINPNVPATRRDRQTTSYAIPADTAVVATLNESLSTKEAKDRDRFTLTVRSPSQYDGAIIDGCLTRVERSGRITGSPEIGFEFESVKLRNGQTHDFAGYIESVRTPSNEKVKVDNEGSVKESSGQTEKTALRGGIGAAIGALIGGLSGGGKGAAIGAAVGVGAGAGSVIVQGRDDLQLDSGTEFNIRTTSATRVSSSTSPR
jgi:hypothetical protein